MIARHFETANKYILRIKMNVDNSETKEQIQIESKDEPFFDDDNDPEPSVKDILDIESMIMNSVTPVVEAPLVSQETFADSIVEPTKPTTISKPKKPKKKELIARIMDIQAREHEMDPKLEPMTKSKLDRMTVDDLEQLLGQTINTGFTRMTEPEPTEPDVKELLSHDYIAKQLYHFNMMFASLTESLSYQFGGVEHNVIGYSKILDENKEALMTAYAVIAHEYKEQISQYLSPVNVILAINIISMGKAYTGKKEFIDEDDFKQSLND
jgi:hypothetical protein